MSNSLVIFTKAALMLAEADTIQKAKELKSMALTAAEWANRKNMGEDAIQHCRSYALEAERKMGQMLRETERAKPPNPKPPKDRRSRISTDDAPTLADLGLSKRESSAAQKLATISQERFNGLKAGQITRVEALNPTHVGHNRGEQEWYTPPEFIETARKTMGSIDCDPASSEVANRIVKAETFFDRTMDGLKMKWHGNVWLNPPYAQPLIAQFAKALRLKAESGEIEQSCVLVNNATETEWFLDLIAGASAVCFTFSRVRFLDPKGNPGAPLQGQAVIYSGRRIVHFASAFSKLGWICNVVH